MNHDTEHVRNRDTPWVIIGIPMFVKLLENPSLARLYISIRQSGATGPELVETTTVSEQTVYDYLRWGRQVRLARLMTIRGPPDTLSEDSN